LTLGTSSAGYFYDALDRDGRPVTIDGNKQGPLWAAYALRLAGTMGWAGPWAALIGTPASLCVKQGSADIDDLALALLAETPCGSGQGADEIGALLEAKMRAKPGQRDEGARSWRLETLLRLFEAFLALEAVEPAQKWRDRADRTARLALELPENEDGFRESASEGTRIVSPAQQYALARLLQTWASLRQHAEGTRAARQLFDVVCRSLDPFRHYPMGALNATSRIVSETSRLETQTERLKAALVMAAAFPSDAPAFLGEAEDALASIQPYLSPDGLWSDRVDERGNASSGVATPEALCALLSAVQSLALSFAADETLSPPISLR